VTGDKDRDRYRDWDSDGDQGKEMGKWSGTGRKIKLDGRICGRILAENIYKEIPYLIVLTYFQRQRKTSTSFQIDPSCVC
jgi:hypothetical protein